MKTVFVKQSPLWAINIMNGTNMWFDDIYVNSTAFDAPYGKNWVQNTDGFDTMDAENIMLTNFVYQGIYMYSAQLCAHFSVLMLTAAHRVRLMVNPPEKKRGRQLTTSFQGRRCHSHQAALFQHLLSKRTFEHPILSRSQWSSLTCFPAHNPWRQRHCYWQLRPIPRRLVRDQCCH